MQKEVKYNRLLCLSGLIFPFLISKTYKIPNIFMVFSLLSLIVILSESEI